MWESWRAGSPTTPTAASTFADGLAVRVAIPLAVAELNPLVQRFELVTEPELEAAVRAYAEAGIRVEGAAAAPLALALPREPAAADSCSSSQAGTSTTRSTSRILSRANIESLGFAAAPHDGDPRRPARCYGGGVRDHRAAEAHEEPDLRARRSLRRRASRRRAAARAGRTTISVKLRRRGQRDRRMFDSKKRPVRTLVDGVEATRGLNASAGTAAPTANVIARRTAATSAEIHLAREHRTILLPNRILLDTTPPEIKNAHRTARRSRRTATGRRTSSASLRAQQAARTSNLYLGGERILSTYRHPAKGAVSWYGHGRTAPRCRRATYTLELGAVDLAGNSTPVAERWRVRVEIRYIELASNRIVVRAPAGRSRSVSRPTRSGTRGSSAGGSRLRDRAGAAPARVAARGRYTLTVSEHGHVRSRGGDRQVIGARAARRAGRVPRPRAPARRRTSRRDRLAGLGVRGVRHRACSASPSRRTAPLLVARRRVRGARARRRARGLFRVVPWLLPLARARVRPDRGSASTSAARARSSSCRSTSSILGAAILLAWELVTRRRARARARAAPGRSPAFVALDGPVARVEQGRAARARSSCSRSTCPFTLLALAIARLPWSRLGAARALRASSSVMGLVFAVVGFYQYETRDIFQNPKVITRTRTRRSSASTPCSGTRRSTGGSSCVAIVAVDRAASSAAARCGSLRRPPRGDRRHRGSGS